MKFDGEGFHPMTMRADDHQVIQPLYVMEMDKAGTKGVAFDNEGSGYGFRTLLAVPADKTVAADDLQNDASDTLGVARARRNRPGGPQCDILRASSWSFDQGEIRNWQTHGTAFLP